MKKISILFIILASVVCFALCCQPSYSYEFDEEVMNWALGEDWGSLPLYVIDDVWNERHGDIWFCSGTLVPTEAFDIMTDIYYSRHQKVKDLKGYDTGSEVGPSAAKAIIEAYE